ncbi:MAG TPA: polysaccharide biosynthesis C-terminal domain-containing protein, partial [Actinomycetota bacterium]
DAGLALALAPHLGSRGGAVAQMVALVVSNGLGLYLVWRFVRIQPFNRQYLRLALPTVIGAAVMVGAHLLLRGSGWPADLVGTGLIGGAAYTTLLLTTGLTPGERRTIAAVVSRRRIQGS